MGKKQHHQGRLWQTLPFHNIRLQPISIQKNPPPECPSSETPCLSVYRAHRDERVRRRGSVVHTQSLRESDREEKEDDP